EGTDVDSAAANLDPTTGSRWKVDITFSGAGAERWGALTREAYNNEGGACIQTQPNDQGGSPVCQVAVVLDNMIVSAPAVQGVQSGNSQITGDFDRASATLLANQLRYGALPVTFSQGEVQTITATLGAD